MWEFMELEVFLLLFLFEVRVDLGGVALVDKLDPVKPRSVFTQNELMELGVFLDMLFLE